MMRAPLVIGLLILAPMVAANDWPQWRYNETHQGSVPATENDDFGPFVEKWWGDLSVGPNPGSPSVYENIVYVGDSSGKVYALDQESGGELWPNKTAGAIKGTPAVGPINVYVMDVAGSIYAFDRKTGTQVGSPISVGATDGSVLLHEDILYAGTRAGTVKAYFASTQTEKWSFSTSGTFFNTTCATGNVEGTPVIYQSQLLFGTTGKCFFSVDTTAVGSVTEPRWVFQSQDSIRSSPAIDLANGRVVFGDLSGRFYAIALTRTGAVSTADRTWTEPLTSNNLPTEIKASPALVGDKIIIAARNGNVRALKATDLTSVWVTNLNKEVISSPAVANGYVLVGSKDRYMYMLRVADGTEADKRLASSEIEVSPAISGTQGIWASVDGVLYSFGGTKPERPDLAVTSFSVPSLYRGDSGTISIGIENVGALAAPATNGVVLVQSSLLEEFAIPALDPGQATSASVTFRPSSTGTMTVSVLLDASRTVQEADEANNADSATITVNERPATTTTTGGGDEEEGVPGFGALLVFSALAAVIVAARRRP